MGVSNVPGMNLLHANHLAHGDMLGDVFREGAPRMGAMRVLNMDERDRDADGNIGDSGSDDECDDDRACGDDDDECGDEWVCGRACTPPPHRDELRELIVGNPLYERDERSYARRLNRRLCAHLRGVIEFHRAELGFCSEPFQQAVIEWERMIALPATAAGIAAKRGALLFALWTQPALMEHWRRSDAELVDNLNDWILPLVMPKFVSGMGQRPIQLSAVVVTLISMWEEPGRGQPDAEPTMGV